MSPIERIENKPNIDESLINAGSTIDTGIKIDSSLNEGVTVEAGSPVELARKKADDYARENSLSGNKEKGYNTTSSWRGLRAVISK